MLPASTLFLEHHERYRGRMDEEHISLLQNVLRHYNTQPRRLQPQQPGAQCFLACSHLLMSSLFTLPTYTPPAEALTDHQPVERSSHLIAHTGESSRSVRPLQQVILFNGRKNGSEHRWKTKTGGTAARHTASRFIAFPSKMPAASLPWASNP